MQLFIDSAKPDEIKEALRWGFVDGVTTNPTLASEVGKPYKEIVADILAMTSGPVSLETVADDTGGILREARALAKLQSNVYVKIPCTLPGYEATNTLKAEGINVNMTLCFSVNQALLAAKVGADFVSPYLGRVDDFTDGLGDEFIGRVRKVYDNYHFKTKILAASIHDVEHVSQVAEMGADIATVPFAILKNMTGHPLTKLGQTKFLKDWHDSGLELPV